MLTWWLDVLLALGLTLRLTRLVTTDDLGLWFVRGPAAKWAVRETEMHILGEISENGDYYEVGRELRPELIPKRAMLVSGLECPYCVGFWLGVLVLVSLWLVGGPGDAVDLWRWIAAAFSMNYIVGHISSRMD